MHGEINLKPSFNALSGKVIFLHYTKGTNPNAQLSKVVSRLHGEISEFFDSRVQILITNRSDLPSKNEVSSSPSPSDSRSSPAGVPNITPSPSSQTLSHLSPLDSPFASQISPYTSTSPGSLTRKCSNQSSTGSATLSRGQRMTLMTKNANSTDDIVEKALRRNILVLTVKEFWKWFYGLPNEIQIYIEEVEPNVIEEDKKLDIKVGVRPLRVPCFKVLDMKNSERPMAVEATNFEPKLWPAEDFKVDVAETHRTGSKKTPGTNKKGRDVRKNAAATRKRWKKKLAKMAEKQKKPARVNVCEGCHASYRKLDQHLVTASHKAYAEKSDEMLKTVDDLIKKLPTFQEALQIGERRLNELQSRLGSVDAALNEVGGEASMLLNKKPNPKRRSSDGQPAGQLSDKASSVLRRKTLQGGRKPSRDSSSKPARDAKNEEPRPDKPREDEEPRPDKPREDGEKAAPPGGDGNEISRRWAEVLAANSIEGESSEILFADERLTEDQRAVRPGRVSEMKRAGDQNSDDEAEALRREWKEANEGYEGTEQRDRRAVEDPDPGEAAERLGDAAAEGAATGDGEKATPDVRCREVVGSSTAAEERPEDDVGGDGAGDGQEGGYREDDASRGKGERVAEESHSGDAGRREEEEEDAKREGGKGVEEEGREGVGAEVTGEKSDDRANAEKHPSPGSGGGEAAGIPVLDAAAEEAPVRSDGERAESPTGKELAKTGAAGRGGKAKRSVRRKKVEMKAPVHVNKTRRSASVLALLKMRVGEITGDSHGRAVSKRKSSAIPAAVVSAETASAGMSNSEAISAETKPGETVKDEVEATEDEMECQAAEENEKLMAELEKAFTQPRATALNEDISSQDDDAATATNSQTDTCETQSSQETETGTQNSQQETSQTTGEASTRMDSLQFSPLSTASSSHQRLSTEVSTILQRLSFVGERSPEADVEREVKRETTESCTSNADDHHMDVSPLQPMTEYCPVSFSPQKVSSPVLMGAKQPPLPGTPSLLSSPFKSDRRSRPSLRGRIYATPSPRRRASTRLFTRMGGVSRTSEEIRRERSPEMECRFISCPGCGAFHFKPSSLPVPVENKSSLQSPTKSSVVPDPPAATVVKRETASTTVRGETAASTVQGETAPTIVQGETAASIVLGETAARTVLGETASTTVQGETAPTIVLGETAASTVQGETAASTVLGETASTTVLGETASTTVLGETAPTIVQGETAASIVRGETASTTVQEETASTIVLGETASTIVRGETAASIVLGETASTTVRGETAPTIVLGETAPTIVQGETAPTIVLGETAASTVLGETESPLKCPSGRITRHRLRYGSPCSPTSPLLRGRPPRSTKHLRERLPPILDLEGAHETWSVGRESESDAQSALSNGKDSASHPKKLQRRKSEGQDQIPAVVPMVLRNRSSLTPNSKCGDEHEIEVEMSLEKSLEEECSKRSPVVSLARLRQNAMERQRLRHQTASKQCPLAPLEMILKEEEEEARSLHLLQSPVVSLDRMRKEEENVALPLMQSPVVSLDRMRREEENVALPLTQSPVVSLDRMRKEEENVAVPLTQSPVVSLDRMRKEEENGGTVWKHSPYVSLERIHNGMEDEEDKENVENTMEMGTGTPTTPSGKRRILKTVPKSAFRDSPTKRDYYAMITGRKAPKRMCNSSPLSSRKSKK